jgi:hypothetical protein
MRERERFGLYNEMACPLTHFPPSSILVVIIAVIAVIPSFIARSYTHICIKVRQDSKSERSIDIVLYTRRLAD